MADDDFIEPPASEDAPTSHYDDLVTARGQGYSWPEIDSDLQQRTATAYGQGYTQREIDDHLGFIEPGPMEQRAKDTWTAAMARDPQLLTGLAAPDPKIDLEMAPGLRADYAQALLAGEVRSPQDFAQRYAASALDAAHDIYGLPVGDAADARLLAGAIAADLTAPTLPTVEDLTDATLSTSNADPEAVDHARQTLLDRWQQDGTPPIRQAIDASVNPLVAALYQPAVPTIPTGSLAHALVNLGFGIQEGLLTPGADLAEKLKDGTLTEALGAAIGRVPRAFWEAFQGSGETIAAAARGEPVSAADALETALMMVNPSRFPGGGTPYYGDILPPLPRAPLPELPSPRGPIIEGEVAGPMIKLPPPPPVPVVDLDLLPGQPMRLISAREAFEPPRSAEILNDAAARLENLRLENEGLFNNPVESGNFFQRIAAQMADDIHVGGQQPGIEPITVYHGSPYDFDAFDLNKIGTGEGAQSYGRGLYFAEEPMVADGYRFTADAPKRVSDPAHDVAMEYVKEAGGDRELAARNLLDYAPGMTDLAEYIRNPTGALYKANLHVDKNNLIDWDEPITKQSEAVQSAFAKLGIIGDATDGGEFAGAKVEFVPQTGGEVIKRLETRLGEANIVDALKNEGIEGIRYLDQFSRYAELVEPEGAPATRNYVIFHDNKIEMLEKNGKPIKPAEVQQQVEGLSEGYQGAKAVYGYFKSMMGDMLADDSGSWNIRRSPQERALRQESREKREELRSLLLREQGIGEQEIANVAARLQPLYKYINPHMPEWQAEIAKGPAGDPMMTTLGGLTNFIEGVGYGPVLRLDHPVTPVASMIRDINVEKYQMLQDAFARGDIDAPGYRDNYFRHLWTDPAAGSAFFNQHQAVQGSGRQGSMGTLRQRTLPTVADGLRAGLQPAIPHPLDLTLYDISSTVKMLHSTRVRKEMADLGLLNWRSKPEPGEMALSGVGVQRAIATQKPLRFRQIEADARSALAAAIAAGRDTTALRAAVAAATKAAEPGAMMQQAYAIPAVARMYNNWLSIGWHSHPVSSDLYQNLMFMKNTLTGLKLLAPIFHSVVIAEQTLAAGMAEAMMHATAGNVAASLMELAKTGLAVPKAIQTYRRGVKARDDYVKMAGDPILQQLVEAGLRIGPRQAVYQMSASSYWHGIAQNNAGNTIFEKLSNVAKAGGRELHREIETIGGPEGEPLPKTLAMLPLRVAKVPLDELGRAMTTISAPLFDHIIPVMKAGSAVQLFETWLRTHPGASEAVVKKRAQQIVEDIDNRLGEMNFDTVFANQWLKQTANMATISASWAFGTWRWTADALGLRGRFNPIALQTLMGAATIYAGMNGILTTLHTGALPTDPWDFVNFRTGTTTAGGQPQRGLVPTEFKEYFDVGKILATAYGRGDPTYVFRGVAEYVLGKENATFGILRANLTGEDPIGHKIAYTPGGWLKFYEEQVFPLVLENYLSPKAGTGLNAFESTFIRTAPTWITDPAAFYGQQQGLANRWTKEELGRAKRENSKLENPDPNIGLPGKAPRSGGHAPRPSKASKGSSNHRSPTFGR